MLTEAELDKGINEIPPLPEAVIDAMALLNCEEVDFNKLHSSITQDVSLSGRVLAVSNSSFYGMPGQIGSVKEACVILGTHTLRNVILAAGMIGEFPADASNNINISELWRHAYATGVTARLLAYECDIDQEKAFTAGLLHDIGKMVLDVYFSAQYHEVIQYRDKTDCLLRDAEMHILGFSHALVGSKLASCWHLPDEIVSAIRGHHLDDSQISPFNDVIHIADIVSRALDIGDAGDSLVPVLNEQALRRIGMTLSQVAVMFPKIEMTMEASRELLA